MNLQVIVDVFGRVFPCRMSLSWLWLCGLKN